MITRRPAAGMPAGADKRNRKASTPVAVAPAAAPSRPGRLLKKLRLARSWTLKEVSDRTGYPVSTLSKIENDRVSLTYDKLTRLSAGLEVDISEFFGTPSAEGPAGAALARRSVTRAGEGNRIESQNYTHFYPAAELLNKRLIPIVVDLHARSLEEFGELVRHSGEEYALVIEGVVEVHTSAYAPVRLRKGDSIYLDSEMGHGFVAAAPGPCRIVVVCSGSERQLVAAVGGRPAVAGAPSRRRRPRARAR